MRRFSNLLMVIVLCIGCSTEETLTENPDVKAGVFLDSEVSGLDFETSSMEGKTDVSGEFLYTEGEQISFFLGEVSLGTTKAAPVLSPADLFPHTGGSLHSREAKNLAALLQTLDHDGDPTDGIEIKTSTVEAIELGEIDFSRSIVHLLGILTADVNQQTGSNLKPVYPEQAAMHLHQTFGQSYTPENPVIAFFLPAVEGWHEFAPDGVHWIHQTDENDGLELSVLYDKRPFRPIVKTVYVRKNEEGLPLEINQTIFGPGDPQERQVSFTYSVGNQLKSIEVHQQNQHLFTAEVRMDRGGHQIYELLYFDRYEQFIHRTRFIYDRRGLKTHKLVYHSEKGEKEDDIQRKTHYKYTGSGEYRTIVHYDTQDIYTEVYRYRDDLSLKKIEYYRYSDPSWKRTEYYNKWERLDSVSVSDHHL